MGTPEEPNGNGIFLGLAPTDKVMIFVGLLRESGFFFPECVAKGSRL